MAEAEMYKTVEVHRSQQILLKLYRHSIEIKEEKDCHCFRTNDPTTEKALHITYK
jgi:hypothetical protein